MTHGITITNDNSHILISSDIPSFHYAGTATFIRTTLTGMTEFDGFAYGEEGDLNGRFVHLYEITLRDGTDPLVFIRPGNNTESYGILRKYIKGTGVPFEPPDPYGGGGGGGGDPIDPIDPIDPEEPFFQIEKSAPIANSVGTSTSESLGTETTWEIEIIQRGTISRPPKNILCFTQLFGVTEPVEDYGIITRLADGTIAFDAARMPLSLVDTKIVKPPEVPINGGLVHPDIVIEWGESNRDPAGYLITGPEWQREGTTAGLYYNRYTNGSYQRYEISFRCEQQEDLFDIDAPLGMDDIAFTAPAIAQGCYTYTYYVEKESSGIFSGTQYHQSLSSWFCLYHQTYRLDGVANPKLAAGWTPFYGGYWYEADWTSGGLFGGSGGSVVYGVEPYKNKTINYGNNVAMFIDARAYIGQEIDVWAYS